MLSMPNASAYEISFMMYAMNPGIIRIFEIRYRNRQEPLSSLLLKNAMYARRAGRKASGAVAYHDKGRT